MNFELFDKICAKIANISVAITGVLLIIFLIQIIQIAHNVKVEVKEKKLIDKTNQSFVEKGISK